MIIDIRFSSGMILHNYKIKTYSVAQDGWMTVIEETDAITYINLSNIDLFTIYEEKENGTD